LSFRIFCFLLRNNQALFAQDLSQVDGHAVQLLADLLAKPVQAGEVAAQGGRGGHLAGRGVMEKPARRIQGRTKRVKLALCSCSQLHFCTLALRTCARAEREAWQGSPSALPRLFPLLSNRQEWLSLLSSLEPWSSPLSAGSPFWSSVDEYVCRVQKSHSWGHLISFSSCNGMEKEKEYGTVGGND